MVRDVVFLETGKKRPPRAKISKGSNCRRSAVGRPSSRVPGMVATRGAASLLGFPPLAGTGAGKQEAGNGN